MTTLDIQRVGAVEERRVTWPQIAALVLTVLGWVYTVVMTSGASAAHLSERVNTVETRQADESRRVDELRLDVRAANDKLDRLLERAQR